MSYESLTHCDLKILNTKRLNSNPEQEKIELEPRTMTIRRKIAEVTGENTRLERLESRDGRKKDEGEEEQSREEEKLRDCREKKRVERERRE